jgi:7-cyano-7-deazaguanine synthase in queuosine biosynthesis
MEPAATFWSAEPVTRGASLLWRADLQLDDRWAVRALGIDMPDLGADLLEVAATVHAVDRLVARGSWRRGGRWDRTLFVRIPVRNPELWRDVRSEVEEMLYWLTDDKWSLQFVRGEGPLTLVQQGLLSVSQPEVDVMLFSGGLDSTAGLATDLTKRARRVVPVSVYTNPFMQARQRKIIDVLEGVSCGSILPVQFKVQLGRDDRENTQRSRGFLFLAAGVATAWALGSDRLRIHENGIGTVNLPYLRSQIGSQATRAVHPRTVTMLEGLARSLTGRPFMIATPDVQRTKAELVLTCPPLADDALRLSISCDSGFATRTPGKHPCGLCTSCLLRRMSLAAAGRSDLDSASEYRTQEPAGRYEFGAMRWQVARLRRCFESDDPWAALVSEFPEVSAVLHRLSAQSVTRLYEAYISEWENLLPQFGASRRTETSTREGSGASTR